MTVPGAAQALPRTPAARPSAPAAVIPAAATALTTASAAVAQHVDSASLPAPSVDGTPPGSSSELSLEDITDTETTVEVGGSSPPAPPVREDEIDEDRAYFAPRIVPKAALPTDTEAAKVVINLPGETMSEEITQAIGKSALDQRVLAQRAALARRREPTVRIPRKDVQSVRAEIAAAERAGRAQVATEPDILVQSDSSSIATATSVARPSGRLQLDEVDRTLDPAVGASRSGSSRLTVVALVVVALGALAAGTFYFRQITPSAGALDAAGEKTSAPVAATQPATTKEPEAPTASAIASVEPPLELSAAPATSGDPSVVMLNASAAQGSQSAAVPHPPPGSWAATHPWAVRPGVTSPKPTPATSPWHGPSAKPPTNKPVVPAEI